MEVSRNNFLTSQIISGLRFVKIGGERYKIVPPSLEVKLLAEYIYQETVESLRFDNFMTKGQVKTLLRRLDTWIDKDEEELKKLETWLEDQKLVLYKAFFDVKIQEKARVNIKRAKSAILKALSRKHSLDHTTLDYHGLVTKTKFITALCLRDKNNKSVYTEESFWNSDSNLLEKAVACLESESISIEEFRELARTDPWRTIWSTGKEQCFGVPSSQWTDEQRHLVIFSKMYDNARQSLECPSDEVFEDDDMFDGWMIEQRRKQEEDRKKKEADVVSKTDFGNAGEVFIMAPTQADAQKVYDLNEKNERMAVKERQQYIDKRGKVQAGQLPDTKRDIVTQMASEHKKNKY